MRRLITLLLVALPLLAAATPQRRADWPTPRLARALPPERIAHIITNMPPRRTFRVPTPGLRPWREDRHYSLGDSTTWQRGTYYCLQSHTAHTGAGVASAEMHGSEFLTRPELEQFGQPPQDSREPEEPRPDSKNDHRSYTPTIPQ